MDLFILLTLLLFVTGSNGICIPGSADNRNCIETVSSEAEEAAAAAVALDKPFKLNYRLRNIDQAFDDYEIKSEASLEAEGVDTTLKQVLLIHRHGDRTPISFPPRDPLKDEPFWQFHGYGQLTNRGKARLFLLGKLMRARYNRFMDKKVNKNQRISRSSGSLRCIESAQCFLSSFLSLNQTSSNDASQLVWDRRNNLLAYLWQPASIQSVPSRFDSMLAEGAECKRLTNEYENVIEKLPESMKIYSEYKHEAAVINEEIGFEMDHFYKWFWAGSQIEVERSYFADKLSPRIVAIFDRLQEAGNRAMGLYQSTLNSKRLRSGVLINDMITNMVNFRDSHHKLTNDNADDASSSELKKFVHYSSHDLILVVLLGMLDSWEKFPYRPEYGSNIVMELHHDESPASEWFVRVFYMPFVPSKPIELHLSKCASDHPKARCTLDKFKAIMQPYMIASWQNWMKECDNTLDQVDPYAPGS